MTDTDPDSTWAPVSLSSRTWRDIALTLLVAILVGYGWHFLQFDTPNERARIYLTVSMVDRGEVTVDEEVAQWGDVYDLSRYEGHWYCNKPPGSSLLGAALYTPLRWASPDSEWNDKQLLLLMRFGVMLPLSLLGFVVIRLWLRRIGIGEVAIDLASLAWVLGSAAFHYAGAFYSHQIVAVCFVVGGYLVDRVRRERRAPPDDEDDRDETAAQEDNGEALDWRAPLQMLVAGLSLGLAGATEYQAGIVCLFIALFVVASRPLRSWRLLLPFGLGAGTFVVILLVYHDLAFGGPFQLTYFHHRGGGVAPITLPKWEYVKGVLVSPHRGLLTTNPWFFMVLPGAWYLFSRGDGENRGLALLLLAGFMFRFFFLVGYKNWHGSWSFGLRHLVPQMGFMTVLCAATMDEWLDSILGSFIVRSTILMGLLYNQVMDAFNAVVPPTTRNPLMDMILPMFQNGIPTPNVVQVLTSLEGLDTLIPLVVLVLLTAIFVLVRGLEALPTLPWRIAVPILSILPAVALGAWLYGLGHDWSEKARNDWSGWIQNWHAKERRFHGLDDDS